MILYSHSFLCFFSAFLYEVKVNVGKWTTTVNKPNQIYYIISWFFIRFLLCLQLLVPFGIWTLLSSSVADGSLQALVVSHCCRRSSDFMISDNATAHQHNMFIVYFIFGWCSHFDHSPRTLLIHRQSVKFIITEIMLHFNIFVC